MDTTLLTEGVHLGTLICFKPTVLKEIIDTSQIKFLPLSDNIMLINNYRVTH